MYTSLAPTPLYPSWTTHSAECVLQHASPTPGPPVRPSSPTGVGYYAEGTVAKPKSHRANEETERVPVSPFRAEPQRPRSAVRGASIPPPKTRVLLDKTPSTHGHPHSNPQPFGIPISYPSMTSVDCPSHPRFPAVESRNEAESSRYRLEMTPVRWPGMMRKGTTECWRGPVQLGSSWRRSYRRRMSWEALSPVSPHQYSNHKGTISRRERASGGRGVGKEHTR